MAELGKVYDAIPNEVYVADDVKIIIPISAAKFYQQSAAQAALGYLDKYHVGAKPIELSRN